MTFIDLTLKLQKDLGFVDLTTRPSRPSRGMELLVAKLDRLKVKMYQEQGHALPHIHIDYGKQHHAASFAINPPERIEGQLDGKYDRAIQAWLTQNEEALIALWAALQAGEASGALIAEMNGDLV